MKSVIRKLLKGTKQLFLKIDQYGRPVNFLVKKEKTYNTLLGSIISSIIFVIVGFSFVVFTLEMVDGNNPQVVTNVEYTPEPELTLTDHYGIPVVQTQNSTIYNVFGYACLREDVVKDGQVQFQYKCDNYSFVPCSSQEQNVQLAKDMDVPEHILTTTMCINKDEWQKKSIFLGGTGGSKKLQSLTIQVMQCENGTSTNICAPIEVIEKQISFGYMGLMMPDRLVNQKKSRDPFVTVNKLIQASFSNKQFKQVRVYMRHSHQETFENFFYYFGHTYLSHYLVFDSFTEYVEYTPRADQQILEVLITLEDRKITYYRTYDNILKVLANVMGLFNPLIIIGSLIVSPLSNISFDLLLCNTLFSFEKPNHENSPRRRRAKVTPGPIDQQNVISENNRKKTLNPLKSLRSQLPTRQDKDSIINEIKKHLSLQYNSIKLGLLDYLFVWRKRKAQVDKGADTINKRLDIMYVIKKLMEIDKLKQLLLTQQQIKLLEYLPKPYIQSQMRYICSKQITNQYSRPIQSRTNIKTISRSSSESALKNIKEESSLILFMEEAIDAYRSISSNTDDPVNDRLINLIDPEVRVFFDDILEEDDDIFKVKKLEENQIFMGQLEEVLEQRNNYDNVAIQANGFSTRTEQIDLQAQ